MMKVEVPESLMSHLKQELHNCPFRKFDEMNNPGKLLFHGPFGVYELVGIPDESLIEEVEVKVRQYKSIRTMTNEEVKDGAE